MNFTAGGLRSACRGLPTIGMICLILLGCGRSAGPSATNSSSRNSNEDPASATRIDDVVAKQAAASSAAASDSHELDEAVDRDEPHSDGKLPEPDVTSAAEILAAGSWSVQRFIVLAGQGPLVIDLHCQVDSVDLETALRERVGKVCDELMLELGEPVSWDQALQSELIRSGWLGALVTQDDQKARIIQLYDANQNSMVETDELSDFVSLGPMQQEPLSFRDESASTARSVRSPWGPLDRDDDHSLDPQEVSSAASSLFNLDFDGDANISLAEVNPTMEAGERMPGRRIQSMLPVETVIFESSRSKSLDDSRLTKSRQNLASKILQHYTYLDSIERDEWRGCTDRLWNSLETSRDGKLDFRELTEIFSVEPNCRLLLRLTSTPQQANDDSQQLTEGGESSELSSVSSPLSSTVQWVFDSGDLSERSQWNVSGPDLRVVLPGLNLQIKFEEILPPAMNSLLAAQLNAGLQNAQVRAAIAAQLQLSESAFDLIDSNSDQQLSDPELQRVLGWIRCRQMTRLQAGWSMSPNPWFQILDQDMNLRISEWEISQIGSLLSALDTVPALETVAQSAASQDDTGEELNKQGGLLAGPISADRLPTIATIRIRQGDERFAIPENQLAALGAQSPTRYDWFAAMDSNGDSAISRAEFLGNRRQFEQIDRDGNGFLSRAETLQYVQK